MELHSKVSHLEKCLSKVKDEKLEKIVKVAKAINSPKLTEDQRKKIVAAVNAAYEKVTKSIKEENKKKKIIVKKKKASAEKQKPTTNKKRTVVKKRKASNYSYIPNDKILQIEAIKNSGKEVTIKAPNILDGAYVKQGTYADGGKTGSALYKTTQPTLDFEMSSFQSYLQKNGIRAIRLSDKITPIYIYLGSKQALLDMLVKYWYMDEPKNEALELAENDIEKYTPGEALFAKGGKMHKYKKAKEKISGYIRKSKPKAKKASDFLKGKYQKAADYTSRQIKEQKKKVALSVLDETKDKYTSQESKLQLKAAQELVKNKYDSGGLFGGRSYPKGAAWAKEHKYKSKESHEKKYKRKTAPKNMKYKKSV